MTDIKFCGMTRTVDAQQAAALGARYVGVILTSSPRRVDADEGRAVFAGLPSTVQRVGVFGHEDPATIVATAKRVGVDVIQLHGDQPVDAVASIRAQWDGAIWWVARVSDASIPTLAFDHAPDVDAIVLDARVSGKLGGTGVQLAWDQLRADVDRLRSTARRLVLAGGLDSGNVGRALTTLRPDVVDVSSGVERSPGIKDHERMRAFRDAVRVGVGV
jgi:phosphoribosylanthranilate isomerase